MLSDPGLVAAVRWGLEALALAVQVGVILYLVYQWGAVPQRVPSHFDWRGRPDAWAGRWVLWLMVGVMVSMYVAMSQAGGTLRLIEGDVETRMRESLVMGFVKLGTVAALGCAIVTMVRVAQGVAQRLRIVAILLIVAATIAPAMLLGRN
jgi:uncharacterized membrane protein